MWHKDMMKLKVGSVEIKVEDVWMTKNKGKKLKIKRM